MKYFDAHCDSVTRVLDRRLDFISPRQRAHVDLPRLLEIGSCVQLFAICVTENAYPGQDLEAMVKEAIAIIKGWSHASDGRMGIALTADDIQVACHGGGFRGLLGLEGADCLNRDAENLRHLVDAGIRALIPAWGDNAFCGTVFGENGPLSPEGIKLVELAVELHVMVDVSHLSDAAFFQLVDISAKPFIASHSNCREICPNPRNLSDEMIRRMADQGGVIGINVAPSMLDPDVFMSSHASVDVAARRTMQETANATDWQRFKDHGALRDRVPVAHMSWIAQHVKHAMNVGGEECVGLGGDLDGLPTLAQGVTGIESYPMFAEMFRANGLTEAQVEKVCWRNLERAFTEVLE